MNRFPNYYKVLDVEPDVGNIKLLVSFIKKLKLLHAPENNGLFELVEAFIVLRNEQHRKIYYHQYRKYILNEPIKLSPGIQLKWERELEIIRRECKSICKNLNERENPHRKLLSNFVSGILRKELFGAIHLASTILLTIIGVGLPLIFQNTGSLGTGIFLIVLGQLLLLYRVYDTVPDFKLDRNYFTD